MYPLKLMNQKLKLSVEYVSGSIAQGYVFSLHIVNISKGSVWFPGDLGIIIYQYDDMSKNWMEVNNNVTVINPMVGYTIEPKGKKHPYYLDFYVSPDLPEGNEGKVVRVVAMGKVSRNGSSTDEVVGGWLDVALSPYGRYY